MVVFDLVGERRCDTCPDLQGCLDFWVRMSGASEADERSVLDPGGRCASDFDLMYRDIVFGLKYDAHRLVQYRLGGNVKIQRIKTAKLLV